MSNIDAAKTCDSCEARWAPTAILCRDCDDVLEDVPYRNLLWRCVAAGVMFQMLFGRYADDSFWGGALHHTTTFLFVLYPLRKLADKLANRRRRVLWEMGSLFSDRYSRGLVTALLVFVIVNIVGPDAAFTGAPDWYVAYDNLSTLWIRMFGLGAFFYMLIDQGLAFFDLRKANTYAERGRYTSDSH